MAETITVNLQVDSSKGVKGIQNLEKQVSKLGGTLDKNAKQNQKNRKSFKNFTDTASKGLQSANVSSLLFASGNQTLQKVVGGTALAMKGLASANSFLGAGLKVNIGILKLFRLALIGTGVGALVVGLGALITFLTKSKRGVEAMNTIMAGFEAAVAVVTDRVAAFGAAIFDAVKDPEQALRDFGALITEFVIGKINLVLDGVTGLGKAIALVFKGEFKEALETGVKAVGDLTDGLNPLAGAFDAVSESIAGVTDEITREAQAAINLERRLNRLKDAERAIGVERSKASKQIAELRFIAEDRTNTEEKRLKAIQDAGKIEEAIVAKEIANAKERVAIITAQVGLGESLEEDLQKQADAEIRLNNLLTSSFNLRKGLAAREEGLRREVAAANQADTDKKAETAKKERETEKSDAEASLELEILLAGESEQLLRESLERKQAIEIEFFKGTADELALLKEQQLLESQAFEEKVEADNQKSAEDRANARLSIAQSVAGGLAAASDLIVGNSKKAERARKALALAGIAIDTATAISGVVAAATKDPTSFASPIAFAANIATRSLAVLTNIAKARKLLGGGGGGATATAGAPAGGGRPQAPQAPQLGTVQTTEIEPVPLKAFVVESEVTQSQNRIKNIEENAKIG